MKWERKMLPLCFSPNEDGILSKLSRFHLCQIQFSEIGSFIGYTFFAHHRWRDGDDQSVN